MYYAQLSEKGGDKLKLSEKGQMNMNKTVGVTVVVIVVIAVGAYLTLGGGGGGEQPQPGDNELPPLMDRNPIKIGTWQPTTGPLASGGTASLLTLKIWRDEINEAGGLPVDGVNRPVKIVQHDAKSDTSYVPTVVSTLINQDKVDILFSGYATTMVKPGVALGKDAGLLYIGHNGTHCNYEIQYRNYISINCSGPSWSAWSGNVFDIAEEQGYETAAVLCVNNEMCKGIYDHAVEAAEAHGLEVVYKNLFPPGTTSFDSMLRSIKEKNPDVVYFASYPTGTTNIVRTAHTVGLKPKMMGGGLIGTQYTSVKQSLGKQLNGWISMGTYMPVDTLNQFEGVDELLSKYQDRAEETKADPLGYYNPFYVYSGCQILEEAIKETETLDADTLADYIYNHTFDSVMGEWDFSREYYGEIPEMTWRWVQYKNIEEGTLEELKDPNTYTVLRPKNLQSGEFIPYDEIW